MIRDLLREGDWMASIDLKDAYLSVTIWQGHCKYLKFPRQGSLYEFQSLPFSLSSAPRVFTKLLKPILARLPSSRYEVKDDMLVMAKSKLKLESHIAQITSLLESLGFVVNRENFQLVPAQEIQYLGFMVDSKDQADKREGNTNINGLQEGKREGIHISERISQIDRQDDGNSSCNSSSPAVVQKASCTRGLSPLIPS